MDTIPECFRVQHAEYQSILLEMASEDRIYDQLLMEGNVEIHSAQFSEKLNSLIESLEDTQDLFRLMIRICNSQVTIEYLEDTVDPNN